MPPLREAEMDLILHLNLLLKVIVMSCQSLSCPSSLALPQMTLIESQLAMRGVYRIMNWHLSTFPGMRTTMAPIMVCFPSITSSTISFRTLILQSKVIAQASGALHRTFSYYIGWPTSPMHQRIFLGIIDDCSQPWNSVCHICSIHSEDHQL
jgi:hypothetical protein